MGKRKKSASVTNQNHDLASTNRSDALTNELQGFVYHIYCSFHSGMIVVELALH